MSTYRVFADPALRAFMKSRDWQLATSIDPASYLPGTWFREVGPAKLRLAWDGAGGLTFSVDHWGEGTNPSFHLDVAEKNLRATLDELFRLIPLFESSLADPQKARGAMERIGRSFGVKVGWHRWR